jgi:hypothetical protein
MKGMFQISVLSLTVLMFFAGCGKRSVEYSVMMVPGANATRIEKYRFEIFRNAPETRAYVKIAEVTAETTNIEKAKDIFTKQGKKIKGQAAVNIRAVKVGNYRGLSVHHWVADIVVWQ